MRGCLRLQVKNKLYQAFGESPKTHIGGSTEVSMVSEPVYNLARRHDCQPEMQVKDGSIASSLSGISLEHYIVCPQSEELLFSQKRVGMKLYYKHLRRKFMEAVQYADMRS